MPTSQATLATSLFVFAHPDDEFGCFEAIRLATAQGGRAVCMYLTDGAFGGQPAVPRMRESVGVLGRLGVAAHDIHFIGVAHDIADGSLPQHTEMAYQKLSALMEGYDTPAHVYSTAWEGGHQDHDATFLIARAYVRDFAPHSRHLQFSLYNGQGLAGPLFRVLSPLRSQGAMHTLAMPLSRRLFYLRLCLGYPSQWKAWLGLFPFVALTLVFRGTYLMQEAKPGAMHRPHEGALLYERRSPMTWDAFSHACAGFMQR
jgi:N-acetylglucosamine malate deacetylase 1